MGPRKCAKGDPKSSPSRTKIKSRKSPKKKKKKEKEQTSSALQRLTRRCQRCGHPVRPCMHSAHDGHRESAARPANMGGPRGGKKGHSIDQDVEIWRRGPSKSVGNHSENPRKGDTPSFLRRIRAVPAKTSAVQEKMEGECLFRVARIQHAGRMSAVTAGG